MEIHNHPLALSSVPRDLNGALGPERKTPVRLRCMTSCTWGDFRVPTGISHPRGGLLLVHNEPGRKLVYVVVATVVLRRVIGPFLNIVEIPVEEYKRLASNDVGTRAATLAGVLRLARSNR